MFLEFDEFTSMPILLLLAKISPRNILDYVKVKLVFRNIYKLYKHIETNIHQCGYCKGVL